MDQKLTAMEGYKGNAVPLCSHTKFIQIFDFVQQ